MGKDSMKAKREPSKMTVKELQQALKKRKLDPSGRKAELVERLEVHLHATDSDGKTIATTSPASSNPAPSLHSDARANNGADSGEGKENLEHSACAPSPTTTAAVEEQQVITSGKADGNVDRGSPQGQRTVATRLQSDAEPSSGSKDKGTGVARTVSEQQEQCETKMVEDEPDESQQSKRLDEPRNSTRPEDEESGATETLRIDNFRRPFTLNAVKALVQERGNYVEDGFWMDSIKTHCYVTYASKTTAAEIKAMLQGRVWPPDTGLALEVSFSDTRAAEIAKSGRSRSKLSLPADGQLSRHAMSARPAVSIDHFFQKTVSKPVIYYLPLTDEQVRERDQGLTNRDQRKPTGRPRRVNGTQGGRRRGARLPGFHR